MTNSDKKAKNFCMKYLQGKGYENLKVAKEGWDIEGEKNGEKYYFEIKSSSSKKKKDDFRGSVMLSELYNAVMDKEHYRFIICRCDCDFLKIFEVDEFMKFCALTTPLLRYQYNDYASKPKKFRETTKCADERLIKEMWSDFEKWKNDLS